MPHVARSNPLRKLRNKQRLEWHQKLILVEQDTPASVLRYTGWLMHDTHFKISDLGYIELSTRKAARELRMSRYTVQRANEWLVARGWPVLIPRHGSKPNVTGSAMVPTCGGCYPTDWWT
jgi:hypothetical protein